MSIDLNDERKLVSEVFKKITNKSDKIDPTISKLVLSEEAKHLKLYDQIESRLKRALKQQEEVRVNQIRKIKDKLFPDNGLQERKENFFQYMLQFGDDLIPTLIEAFDPFETGLIVLKLEKSS